MEKTTNNRKKLWICIAIALALYLARNYFVMQSMQQARAGRIIVALQDQLQKSKAAAATHPAADTPPPTIAAVPVTAFVGKWQGAVVDSRRGACTLTLEVDPIPDKEGVFAGYSSLACILNPMAYIEGHPKTNPQAMLDAVRRGNSATSAIFTGKMDGNSIAFTADKNVGVSEVPGACDMKSLSVTPFGVNQVAVSFKHPPCEEGQLVMRRAS